jgi:hypothetical protein
MTRWLIAALLVVGACGKTEGERERDVTRCSDASGDQLEIQLCLETQFAWKEAEAQTAAVARKRELDSISAWRADSAWAASGATRRAEVRQCAGPELERCLLARFGWPEERARAAEDSVWTANGAAHRRELQSCARDRRANVGSCLILTHKWPAARALAAYDSVQRERMR